MADINKETRKNNEKKADTSNSNHNNSHLDQGEDNDETNNVKEKAAKEEEAVKEMASASATQTNHDIHDIINQQHSVVAHQKYNFFALLNELSRTTVIPDTTHATTAGGKNHHGRQHSRYNNRNRTRSNKMAINRGAETAMPTGAAVSCGMQEGSSSFGHAASLPSSSSSHKAPSAAGSGTNTATGNGNYDSGTTSPDHKKEQGITDADEALPSSSSSQARAQSQPLNNAPEVLLCTPTGCLSRGTNVSNITSSPGAYHVRGPGVRVIDENDNNNWNASVSNSATNSSALSTASTNTNTISNTDTNASTTTNDRPITTTVLSARLAPNESRSNRTRSNRRTEQAQPPTQQQPVVVVNPIGEPIITATAEEYPNNNNDDDDDNNSNHGNPSLNRTNSGGAYDDPYQLNIQIKRRRHCLAGWLIIAVLLVVVALLSLGLAGVLVIPRNNQPEQQKNIAQPSPPPSAYASASANNSASSSQTIMSSPTISKIKSDGILYCGWYYVPGFMYADLESGTLTGLNVALCMAIASAIFDRPEPVPYGLAFGNKQHTAENVFGDGGTANGTVTPPFDFDKYRELNHTFPRVEFSEFLPLVPAQVLPGFAHNMERHVMDDGIKMGGSFSSPYLYQGGVISGDPHFVECAEAKGFKHTDECAGLSVCVQRGFSFYSFLLSVLPERLIHGQIGYNNCWSAFVNGTCTLVMHDETYGAPVELLEQYNYQGDIVLSNAVYNNEPIAMVTFKGDPQLDDFVNAVIQSLLIAEQHNITQATAHLFPQTNVFGEEYKDMFRNAISAVGNFAELYHKYVDPFYPRAVRNNINNGNAPLLSSPPLGKILQLEDYTLGFRLQDILGRGILRCGVRLDRPGFVVQDDTDPKLLTGMDVDFCRAIASSLFRGGVDSVDYILLSHDPSDGYIKLADGQVDVIAGATWNLANDVREPATGLGYAFSLPYFYGYGDEEDNLCLATMQDDQDWSTFVYWIVASTIYAEERGIAQSNSNAMPIIYFFGSGLQRMFRDAIDAVGNYGEIYNHTLEEIIPRSSIPRNHLNYQSNSGPQLYAMPGFF